MSAKGYLSSLVWAVAVRLTKKAITALHQRTVLAWAVISCATVNSDHFLFLLLLQLLSQTHPLVWSKIAKCDGE